jgi:uncharacterized protein YceH (UPF0502 family)
MKELNNSLLDEREIRVLGCLLEKEMATPDYYPLTLNALTNACNQKTNREPVVSYGEETVQAAVDVLRERKLVRQSSVGRALKFEQIFSDARNLIGREKAIICILLLRGPQTIGEIRSRTDRLYPFSDLDEVRDSLASLEEMDLVKKLPLQPGRKEARYSQLLGRELEESGENTVSRPVTDITPGSHTANLIEQLQEQIDRLREEMDQLRREFSAFRSQLE